MVGNPLRVSTLSFGSFNSSIGYGRTTFLSSFLLYPQYYRFVNPEFSDKTENQIELFCQHGGEDCLLFLTGKKLISKNMMLTKYIPSFICRKRVFTPAQWLLRRGNQTERRFGALCPGKRRWRTGRIPKKSSARRISAGFLRLRSHGQ